MRIIDHRRLSAKKKQPKWKKRLRLGLIGFGVLVVAFVLSNAVMALMYHHKVLPRYFVAAVPVGGIPFDQLDSRVPASKLVPAQVILFKDTVRQTVASKDLGVIIDWPTTRQSLRQTRTWIPILSLLTRHEVPATLKVDTAVFGPKTAELQKQFSKQALPERIVFQGDNFVIAPLEPGYDLQTDQLRTQLVSTLQKGWTSLQVPVSVTAPADSSIQLSGPLATLQKQLGAKITLNFGGKTKQLSKTDIGGFYAPSGQTMELSITNMAQVIASVAAGLGVTPVNQDDAVQASLYAINKAQTVNFVLADKTAKVIHYCTAVKGVGDAVLPGLHQKLAATYGDPRGWNQGGSAFVYSQDNCQLRVWLSASQFMTGFGSICDDYYSCTVYPNVIINYNRWQGATDPWNAAGGSLEDYRVMVINHESGHWLGFGHRTCPGAGQPAPVMQQQSISLQGCTFNPWPTPSEIAAL